MCVTVWVCSSFFWWSCFPPLRSKTMDRGKTQDCLQMMWGSLLLKLGCFWGSFQVISGCRGQQWMHTKGQTAACVTLRTSLCDRAGANFQLKGVPRLRMWIGKQPVLALPSVRSHKLCLISLKFSLQPIIISPWKWTAKTTRSTQELQSSSEESRSWQSHISWH